MDLFEYAECKKVKVTLKNGSQYTGDVDWVFDKDDLGTEYDQIVLRNVSGPNKGNTFFENQIEKIDIIE